MRLDLLFRIFELESINFCRFLLVLVLILLQKAAAKRQSCFQL
jgi:hypothetical protein